MLRIIVNFKFCINRLVDRGCYSKEQLDFSSFFIRHTIFMFY